MRRIVSSLLLIGALFGASALCAEKPPPMASLIPRRDFPHVERQAVLMGTEIAVLIATKNKRTADVAIDAALAEIKRIEDLMTDWREESELQKINHAAGIAPAKIDPEILFVLREARRVSELTEGGFDVTYAALGKLWGNFIENPGHIPSAAAIKAVLPLVDYRNLEIDLKKETAFLKKKGMRLGVGGIAKGYAVDRAAMVIKKHGFKDFALKAGGDLTVRGKKEGGLWWVGIQDPRDRTKNIAMLPASNASISTSGDYERYFMVQGKRYAHILNPHTGYPVDYCRSVTIIAKDSYWSDGLSTGVFVLGPEKGMALIERLPDVDGIIIDGEGRMTVSSGLQKHSGR